MKRLSIIMGGTTYYVTTLTQTSLNMNAVPPFINTGSLTGLTTNEQDATPFTDAQVKEAKMAYPGFIVEPYVAPGQFGVVLFYKMGFFLAELVPQIYDIFSFAQYLDPAQGLQATIEDLVVTGPIGAQCDISLSVGGAPFATTIDLHPPGITTFTGDYQIKALAGPVGTLFTANLKLKQGGTVFRTIAIQGIVQ